MIFLWEPTYKIPRGRQDYDFPFMCLGIQFCILDYLLMFTQKSHNHCSVSYLSVLRIRMFILDPNFSIPDPGSKRRRIPDPDRNEEFKHF
jgi:hypothetical protein